MAVCDSAGCVYTAAYESSYLAVRRCVWSCVSMRPAFRQIDSALAETGVRPRLQRGGDDDKAVVVESQRLHGRKSDDFPAVPGLLMHPPRQA